MSKLVIVVAGIIVAAGTGTYLLMLTIVVGGRGLQVLKSRDSTVARREKAVGEELDKKENSAIEFIRDVVGRSVARFGDVPRRAWATVGLGALAFIGVATAQVVGFDEGEQSFVAEHELVFGLREGKSFEIEVDESDAEYGRFAGGLINVVSGGSPAAAGMVVVGNANLTWLNEDLAAYFPTVERGLLVVQVKNQSTDPASALRAGDVLVQVDSVEIDNRNDGYALAILSAAAQMDMSKEELLELFSVEDTVAQASMAKLLEDQGVRDTFDLKWYRQGELMTGKLIVTETGVSPSSSRSDSGGN